MTVDITQEEMNILNLNGITAEEVRDNIQYMRGTGLDDKTIRTQYSETIKQLRPITKLSPNDTARIKDMQKKGAITPFEYASRKAVEYNGTYNNVDKYANLNLTPEQKAKREQNDKEYQQRINDMEQIKLEKQAESERIRAERKAKNAERDARVNNGTASFLDRVGAYLDRQADISARVSASTPALDPVLIMAGVDNTGEPLHPSKYDKTKPINAHESVAKSFMSGGWIPFAGGFIENADKKKAREIKEHIINNEPIREDELKFYNRYLDNLQEESARGYTLGGKITHDFLNSLVRFGGEIATGGWVLKSLGGVTELAEGASLAEKAAHGIKSMAATGAVNTVLPTTWNDTYANYQNRRFDKEFELTDKGTWLLKEAEEKPAISFLKSLGQTFVMFASEASGELLKIPVEGVKGAAGKYVGTPISKYLASNPKLIKFIDNTIPALSKAYEKLNNLPVKGKSLDWLKNAVKFDGFIEEMGEEVVEDIMNITLGTTDEKRTLENYAKAIFKSPDEWAVIAGAVALQGGTLSAASHVLGSYMERNGASDEEIIETLNNLSEGEKEQKIQELISENLINVSEYTNEESEKKSQLKDAYFNQIKKTGMDDNDALSNAELMSEAFAALAKNTGMNLDDVTNEANIVIQNMSDEQAQQMYEADNSAALNGDVVFNGSQLIDDELQKVYDDFSALPEDYSDEADVNNRIQQMQILQDIKDGDLAQEQQQAAQDLIAQYEQTNPQLAAALRKAVENKQNTTNDASGINEVEFQKIDTAGAENNQTALARQEWKNKGTESKFFKKWTDDAPLVTSQEALKYNFKTGEKIAVEGYHGTKRGDRVGEVFRPERATSGPMAFFSSERKISENYAKGKEDTSLSDDMRDYDQWFKIKINGRSIPLKDAWWNLTSQKRQEISEKAPHITYDENGENIIYDENNNRGIGNYDYEIKRYRGNALKTLVEGWLNSGTLWGNEDDFIKVLEMVGIDRDDIDYIDPYTDHSKVYDVYLSFKNPLVTTDIPKKVLNKLNREAKKQPIPEMGYGVDAWDKKYRNPLQWVEALNEDYAKDENSYVWTVIPDWVTDVLKGFGYDGIIDMGGKAGGEIHKVYIPFASEQIKSVDNQGTFDENNPNIYYQPISKTAAEYDYIHNQVTGERIDIEMNDDIKVDKIKPQKISAKLPFKISKKPADNKKNIVKNLDLISKSRDVKNKNTDEIAKVDKSTIEKSISNIPINSNIYNDFCCILFNIEKLYKNAQKILSYKDAKTNTDMIIKRYANVVKINNNNYLLEFILKEKGKVLLYSVKPLSNKDAVLTNAYTDKNLSALNTATYSITDIKKIFKSKLVNEYNNDYKNSQSKQGINPKFQKIQKQSPVQMSLFDTAIQQSLFQQEQIFQPQSETGQNVQLEIGLSYDKQKIEEKKKEEIKTDAITDAGDSLLGNLKKNKKQYTWVELDGMNDLLRKKYLSKSYIYQLPTFEDFKKQGLSDKSIAFISLVYSKINAKPAAGYETKEAQKIYFDGVHEIMEKTIKFAKENDALLSNYSRQSARNDELFNSVFPDTENKKPYNIFTAYPAHNKKAIIVGGNKLVQSLCLGYSTAADIEKVLSKMQALNSENKEQQTKETVTGWRTKFDVAQTYRGWCVADRKSGMIITSKELPTKEIAEQVAEKIYQEVLKNSKNYTENYSELRNHIPRRQNGQNVNPEALIEVFGFRGINFGNWTKQQERQDFVNLAYDSLYDLAELLNLPPKALSLGGKLGLAFGAQGRSKADGHFIPEYNEINLTRKTGAGALAHEWWHALDFYFGDQSKGKEFSGRPALALKEQGLLRKEVYDALANLMEQIKYSPLTEKEIEDKSNSMEVGIHRAIEYYANDIKNSFKKSKKANEISKFVDNIVSKAAEIDISAETDNLNKEYMNLLDERRKTWDNLSKLGNLLHYCKKLQQVQDIAKSSKKYSQYYQNAELLNSLEKGMGKAYWTSSTELGARAFASYILNKTVENNYQNNFLVRDEKGEVSLNVSVLGAMIESKEKGEEYKGSSKIFVEWYPAEQEERERIFSAFDKLFSNIKIREDNGIPILYQSNDDMNSNIENARGFTYQRKNFDGTEKENLIVLLNKKADKSTLMHEFAHVYLITLNNLAQHNDKAKELLMQVNKWLHYDGVEYTEFQHERFANHFVAYVATGRAPSYGLKKVFENFRKWLNDMYSALQAADDVWIDPEAEELFEKLLGDISINAQKQEAEQILNKAHNNAIRRYNDKLEQLKQKYKKNQLTEYQKRYRDAALSIVHYALTNSRMPEAKKYQNYNQLRMILLATSEYKRKSKGVAKQQEEIGEILANLDDAFSANDGFMAGWAEFFSDTGVSYDNQETGADIELATRAFEVLVNGEYAQATPDYIGGEYGDLTEEEKTQTEFELEYIIEEYKNADDKTIPLLAYNEWSKKVHPYIEEDMQKEWERQTNEIDRYQALNKFEQAKEDLKLYAATLKGQGDYSAQFAEYARAIVKRLDFMTENDKAKLFDKLKEFNSFREIERNLDDVMDYAQTLADVSDRRALSEQIDREVKQTIHVWQNGIKKTKYTYPANKLFERLREINKMSVSAVQEMYDAIVNEEEQPDYTSDTVHDKEYYSLLEELFIKYKINGIYYNSTEFLQDLLEKLQTAKYTAKIARDEIDFERRMKQLNLVDECAKAVNERKDEIKEKQIIKKIGKLNSLGFNFNGALKMIFNDKIKNWASFDYLYAKRDAQVGKDRREFLEKAKKIFGYDGKLGDVKLFNRFIDMTQKYYKINQRHSPDIEQGSYRVTQQSPETGFNATQYTQQVRQDIDFAQEWKPIETELSKMEVLYFYIQAKNPTSYVILTDKDKGQFDKYEFDTMLDSLTEQEKMLGDVMQLAAEKYWNGLNAYHIKKYHTELGKVKGYFPRLSELSEVKMLDMFNDYVNQSSTGKFQKQRTAGAGTRIATANALAVLFDHIEKANTVIIMGEHMDEVNRVFTNPDLKRLIENTWGDDVTREFYGQLAGNLFTAQTLTKSLQEKWYGSIISNLIKANIFFKPQIGFKQLISFMNYGKGDEYVSAAEWWAKFMKQTLTPSQWKKNIEFMMENDYLKDRFSRGGSMDALKKELDTRYFSKMSLLDEFWGLPVAVGDISAIILGGKPYIDVLMEKGYTKEQAFRIFIETTVNDQQSSIPSTLSNMQRNAAQSPLAKMAFAYQNTPWQYYRQCTSAIMKAVQSGKKPDIQRAAKMTLLYGWLFPAMFNMASSLSLLTAMGGGDDDDLKSDINPLRTITSVLTQHPILGQWINGILNAADGKAFNSQDLLSKHISNVNKLIRHFKKGEVTLQDLWNSIAAFGESTTGTPLSSMGNAASGVYDVIQGDVVKGALKVLGYTDYRAKKVTGEE